jgi:uncharacterized membrane protein YhiD involved in acid resistance
LYSIDIFITTTTTMSNAAVTEWTALLRVLASAALGGIVGWDRESRHRSSAGIRTHMMVGAGACLFVVTAVLAFAEQAAIAHAANVPYYAANPDRILAGIATGVGFLGGGVIIKTDGHIRGLTTAAGLWTVAGIGATIAYGRWILGSLVVILTVSIELSDIVLNYLHISKGPLEPAEASPGTAAVGVEVALRSPEIVDSSKT